MEQNSLRQKIVILEDNVALAEIYKARLEIIGYTCIMASDGESGLRIIEKELPDLVLLDMMMPVIAGDEVLKQVRASSWGADIPVYVISNLNEEDAPAGLRELGIEGYSVKANLTNDQIDRIVDGILKPIPEPQPIVPRVEPVAVVDAPVEQIENTPAQMPQQTEVDLHPEA